MGSLPLSTGEDFIGIIKGYFIEVTLNSLERHFRVRAKKKKKKRKGVQVSPGGKRGIRPVIHSGLSECRILV